MMSSPSRLARQLDTLSRRWINEGLPSRTEMIQIADRLAARQDRTPVWSTAPRMLTAGLDDGLGQGLDIIERFARLAGATVQRLGLCQHPAAIVKACRNARADLLGLTVIWTDSENLLASVRRNLAPPTRIVAGGPAFAAEPGLGDRCKVTVAANAAYFIQFLLNWTPDADII